MKFPKLKTKGDCLLTTDLYYQAEHRLYVATRNPAKFLAFDTNSGKVVASTPTVGGADDMSFDEPRHQVYISGGDGYISVVKEADADHYRESGRLTTGPGAKTSLFVPEFSAIYVAVPAQGAQSAAPKIFQASN